MTDAMATMLSTAPDDVADAARAQAHFGAVADHLLNGCVLRVGEAARFRLTEIEFYYKGPEVHVDPFAHAERLQLEMGRWYFHRTAGEYRGGTYKGLDISFGDGEAYGGILLRGMEALGEEEALIDGPCLCVDAMLARTGYEDVARLDDAIDEREVWDGASPLSMEVHEELDARELHATARIGLTLKRCAATNTAKPAYILRAYRFLSRPRAIKKGKVHLVMALHKRGLDVESIRAVCGSPKHVIERYVEAFEGGVAGGEMMDYRNKALSTGDLARMHGIWSRVYDEAD